jgi:mono/diheme cytochrome c family protein
MKMGSALLLAIAVSGIFSHAQTATMSTSAGIFTEEQAKRGRAAYSQHCLECHGRDLAGDVENRPLAGGEFITNWEGTNVFSLFERIRMTMPFDKPGTLGRQQVADIVAFLLEFNKFPTGNTELSTKTEILQLIRFENPKTATH